MTRFLIVCIILFYPILSFSQTLAPYAVPGEKSDLCQHVYPLKSADAEPYNPLLDHYDITFTKLDFESTNSSDYIRGYAYIEAKVTAAQLGTFCIQLAQAMRIDSIQFNGLTTAYTHTNDEILIQLSSPLAENTAFKVLIYYRGYGNDDTDYAGGLHHVSSSSKFNYEPLTYSFTQPFGASLWFPCKQLLNDKIDSLHIFVTTHASDKVSANGLLTRVVDLPSNKKRYEWKTRYPVAYYLVAFNVFNYTEYSFYTHPEGFTDSIFIQNFMVDQNHVNAMKNEIDKVNGAMSLYCNLFGMYPFADEKYGHTIWGESFGMEHQTMTSMPYTIDFRRLSHELSHQWFGDWVTCASWQDIWLNEGFATYFDYLALKTLVSEQTGKDRMAYYHSNALKYMNGSVYVPDAAATNESRIFNYDLTYCKGATVLQMLRFELQDDELFWKILRNYLAAFKGGFASTRDFQHIAEETSGKDFGYFFDQWVFGEGYPTIYGDWYQKDNQLTMVIKELTSSTSTTSLFEMLVPYKLVLKNKADTTILLRQTSRQQTFTLPITDEVTEILIDPDNEVLNKDLGMTKITPTSVETVRLIDCRVYPNPFSAEIDVVIPAEIRDADLRIFDSKGMLVLSEKLNTPLTTLETSGLLTGMYIVEVKSANGIYRQKIVKR